MGEIMRLRVTAVWVLLIAATCLSWDAAQNLGWVENDRLTTSAVMIVAFLKARFILLDFMELRQAPVPLRLIAEAWPALVCVAIIVIYRGGIGV